MTSGILSPTHLLIVLVVALIVLGPKRLPGAGRALGHGLREFRDSISGGTPTAEVTEGQPAAALLGGAEMAQHELASREVAPVGVGERA